MADIEEYSYSQNSSQDTTSEDEEEDSSSEMAGTTSISASASEIVAPGRVLCRVNPRNAITIFTVPLHITGDDDYSHQPAGDAHVNRGLYEVEWVGIITNVPTRRLINQSHAFFTQLQAEILKELEPKIFIKYSRFYRVALDECTQSLLEMEKNHDLSSDEREQAGQQAELYSLYGLVWHLCEILYIEVLPVGCLVQQLLEWVRWHDRHNDHYFNEVMGVAFPETHSHYWSTVYKLTLQGRTEDVRKLLSHLSYFKTNKNAFESIDELLRKVPMLNSVVGHSRTELKGLWFMWRQECKRRRERQDFVGCQPLDLLCGLLSGDESCFKHPEVLKSCGMWYNILVGRLLYCSPLIISTDYDLHYIANECLQQFYQRSNIQPSFFDKILLDAFQNKIIDVIRELSMKFSDWWFVSHLTNLLHHCGILTTSHLEYGSDMNEFLLIEYASSLFVHPSFWEVAISYLSYCPTEGRHHMCALIERVPFTTDTKARKIIRVCQQYEMTEQAQSITRVLARRCYQDGRMGSALSWCIKGQDMNFAAFLAEKYFANYEDNREFHDLSVLDYLGDAVLLSKRLAFLSKYRMFQRNYEKGEFESAGKILTSLLTSGVTFKKYWSLLFADTLPLLLLKDKRIFSAQDTRQLMNVLVQLSYDSTTMMDNRLLSNLHLALLRNLQLSLQ